MKNSTQLVSLEQELLQPSFKTKIKRKWKVLIIGFGLLAILLAIFLIVIPSFISPAFKHGEIVESIQELAVLATAEAHVKTIIEQEDNKIFGNEISFHIPGTKRHLLLIVPATVIAGVDLKNVNQDNIEYNKNAKEITINLPHATILQDPSIKMEEVQAFSVEGIFRSQVDWEEGFELASLAKQQIKEEVLAMGLLTHAEQNTKKTLQQFFGKSGYTVLVEFQ